ncbi:MAG: hypothetical protein JWN09_1540 [Microbacteriaceae bacterium]|jgi:hypothetical protein|nr:hypothetical protein [Microbacteriaceae bacterium]
MSNDGQESMNDATYTKNRTDPSHQLADVERSRKHRAASAA